jgi:hypothetical protein
MRDVAPRALAVACILATLGSCASDGDLDPQALPGLYVLFQKKEYQILYGPDGRMERLLRDQNGDGVADVVIVCGPDGKPERTEIDSDGDGVVDRWELFRSDGSLEGMVR